MIATLLRGRVVFTGSWAEMLDRIVTRVREKGSCGEIEASIWCWCVNAVWKERCRRVFGEQPRAAVVLAEQLREEVRLYAVARPEFQILLSKTISFCKCLDE
ncbi:unnamed protein product [Linum trigynum]|uniref:Uncharacterized protein n=1 Tax=Linum trigynum TaxID=586398 RepID=A0AAV2CVD3_9ROSI